MVDEETSAEEDLDLDDEGETALQEKAKDLEAQE